MTQVLTSYQVSATTTTVSLLVGRGWSDNVWNWSFTQTGAGDNRLLTTIKRAANWEVGDAALQLFEPGADYDGPYLVDSNQIAAADDSTLKLTFQNRAVFEYIQITFDYAGGGSRVFSVDLHVS